MATYYVRKSGNNLSAGTSPSTAWLTINKALTSVASGDTVYIGSGTYREVNTATVTPSSETKFIGDVDGTQTGDAGPVIISCFLTDDKTAPSASPTIELNNLPFYTFQNIFFVGGSGRVFSCGATGNHDIKIINCAFMANSLNAGAQDDIRVVIAAGGPGNILIDSCMIIHGANNGAAVAVTLNRHTVDYDSNIVIKNCLMAGGGRESVRITDTGAGAGFGGGVLVYNCSSIMTGGIMATLTANISTSIPCKVYNCYILSISSGGAISANTAGQIIEDFNVNNGSTARNANVTVGSNSKEGLYANLFSFGQERLWGAFPALFGSPLTFNAPTMAFGAQAGGPTIDITGASRPAGGQSTNFSAGCFEFGNSGAKETVTVRTGSASLRITGPGYHDFFVPVDATATTIRVYGQYDSNHGTGNKPQVQMFANGEIGVTGQTVTMTAGANTWEQLTISSFTPTAKGQVTIRLISRSAVGTGNAFFDDFSVT